MDKQRINHYLILLKEGDITALDEIYLLTNKAVFSVAFSILRDSELAKDLMQNTYLKIQEKINQYQPDTNGSAWILTIARNLSINHSKKIAREQTTDFDENEYLLTNTDKHEGSVLKQMKTILNPQELTIVMLHIVSGYKHKEIAEILNKPLGTVLWSYKNSLEKLRKVIGDKNER